MAHLREVTPTPPATTQPTHEFSQRTKPSARGAVRIGTEPWPRARR